MLAIATGAVVVVAAVAATALWLMRAPARSSRSTLEYTQLTNFVDSAVQPALSPDGKMLTLVRGSDPTLFHNAQIYVKLLPDGNAVQVTNDDSMKMSPRSSPDGSR